VINPQFAFAWPFIDGLAVVQVAAARGRRKHRQGGYIDKSGKYLISPQFGAAAHFSDGLAAVRVGDSETGKWGYIDRTGKYLLKPQFDEARAFGKDGLARVRIADKWGYIRR